MQLHVFFSPADLSAIETSANDIYIVIDVIRATTSLAVMFDSGASRVFAASSISQAREAARKFPDRLLCGERNAHAIPGFDYGNSPAQFSQIDLSGRDLILATTNGTRAFYTCPQNSVRLAGCFYNAHAVTTLALSLAGQRNSNIAIVCAAEANYFALDDATCAGYLALELQHQHPTIEIHDDMHGAAALYQAYTPPKVLDYAHSAQLVRAAGLADDLDFCMKIDGSSTVPHVTGREEETGLLVIKRSR